MSVKINKNKLIIEIDCGDNQSPLATLALYQKGLIKLLHIANVDASEHQKSAIEDAMHYTTELFVEMIVSEDQYELINKSLNEKQIEEFNKWGR